MRSNGLIFIVGILFILVTDTLLFLQIRRYLKGKTAILLYVLHSLLFISGLIAYHFFIPRLSGPASYYWIELGIGLLFLFYIPKIIYILLTLLAEILGIFWYRLKRIGRATATLLASFCFLLLLYSITWGRYNYKTETVKICFPQLPAAFDNFRIVQLSDLHLGSFPTRYRGMKKLVDEVNRLRPDVILFTGDMVNNFASEMEPWITELSRLQATYGKFAVTGNHDYGNYTRWADPRKKEQNSLDFFRYMKEAGFHMLNNARVPVVLKGDTLYIAGVENWGNPPFPQYGKLTDALEGTGEHFVILLSHDPSHWRAQVLDRNIPLTLSGHTHAMQMGIRFGKRQWSPAKYIYPEYDGLYEDRKRYLYVSRGQGYLGYPGRIGLRPVVSEIVLTNICSEP